MMSLFKVLLSVLILQSPDAGSLKDQIREDKSPVEIKAKKLKIENKNRKATFSEDVIAVRSDMKMTCNQLTAYYTENGNVDRFECTGNVVLKKGEKNATSDKALYDNAKSLVTMTGNPYYSDGDNRFWGEIVEYDLDRDEVNVKNIKAVIKIKDGGDKK